MECYCRCDRAHPGLTLFKVVIMTLVLLTAGVAIYRSSRRVQQPDIALDEGRRPPLFRLAERTDA